MTEDSAAEVEDGENDDNQTQGRKLPQIGNIILFSLCSHMYNVISKLVYSTIISSFFR